MQVVIEQFDDNQHHDQIAFVQVAFVKHVCSFLSVMDELGNPFKDKDIAGSKVTGTIQNARKIGQDQFCAFTEEYLFEQRWLMTQGKGNKNWNLI